MANDTLEHYTITIPAIPEPLFTVLHNGLRNSLLRGVWQTEVGSWVKEGEEIITYHGAGLPNTKISVVAPISGKIIMLGNRDTCTSWSKQTNSPAWDKDSEWQSSLVVIQPAKGSHIQNVVSKAYKQLIDFVDGFINDPKKLKVSKEFYWQEVEEYLEILKKAEARIQRT